MLRNAQSLLWGFPVACLAFTKLLRFHFLYLTNLVLKNQTPNTIVVVVAYGYTPPLCGGVGPGEGKPCLDAGLDCS